MLLSFSIFRWKKLSPRRLNGLPMAGLGFEPRQHDSRAFQSAYGSQTSSIITWLHVRNTEFETYAIRICILTSSLGHSSICYSLKSTSQEPIHWCLTICSVPSITLKTKPAMNESFCFSTSLPAFDAIRVLDYGHSSRCTVVSHCFVLLIFF